MATINDISAAKAFLCNQLLQLGLGGAVVSRRPTISVSTAVASAGRNVHAIGIGKKVTEGKKGSTKCVRVYVVQKLPLSLLSPRDVVPKHLDGVPTDIVEAEPAFAFGAKKRKTKRKTASKKKRRRSNIKSVSRKSSKSSTPACSKNRQKVQRPVLGGISAGHRDITAGTLGCFCKSSNPSDDSNQLFALSNNHVFANVNQALIGDPLYQPGPADGGGIADYFANLHRYVPIQLGGTTGNRVDAALGQLITSIKAKDEVCSIGRATGTVQAQEDMLVRKHGRTTGYTEGVIDDTDYTGLIGMDHNDPSVVGLFENQLRIVADGTAPFGLGGDSGSVVFHRTKKDVVGLYFAGPPSGMYGLANRIENVLTELEIEIG